MSDDDPWEGSGIGFSPDGLMASLPSCPLPTLPDGTIDLEAIGKPIFTFSIVDEAPDISDELWSALGKAHARLLDETVAKVLFGDKSND